MAVEEKRLALSLVQLCKPSKVVKPGASDLDRSDVSPAQPGSLSRHCCFFIDSIDGLKPLNKSRRHYCNMHSKLELLKCGRRNVVPIKCICAATKHNRLNGLTNTQAANSRLIVQHNDWPKRGICAGPTDACLSCASHLACKRRLLTLCTCRADGDCLIGLATGGTIGGT